MILCLNVAVLHNHQDHAGQILEVGLVELSGLVVGVFDADGPEEAELAVHVQLLVADENAL